ncbi:hypothetical protein [Oceanirhabdus sp. W0125-5]|uniref:hypothetical protein n=1 Tax=Oceanirhabdus sp. W0125-5 TaxID=2999116 RepID=UPI0022F334A0|nr:hypothetical protein [Oceanirhabdus sp. W0125-5]WBW95197.1 hypothetical protein OW730_16050 [Oceanirhabdus sp. W0125-5]
MKKIILLSLLFFFVSSLIGCSKDNDLAISGKYEFDSIVYLSPLSSSSKDYLNKKMKGTVYTINKDSFKAVSSENHYEISKLTYKRNKMDDELVQAFNDSVWDSSWGNISISEYKERYKYSIYNEQNEKINFYLYSMDEELWIASYTDNTANNSEIIMSIYKLK